MRFAGKTMIVTGAAQGIGRRVAERAAEEGADVLIADRSPALADAVRAIRQKGGKAQGISADLETWDGCQKTIRHAVDLFGRIDILINNVGGAIWMKPFEFYEPGEIEAEVSRSLFPALYCCRAALEPMLEAGRGVIVNVSSVATRGVNRVPYSAAKGGINALTASLAWEVAERGIRVVAVAPGGTEAPARIVARNLDAEGRQRSEWQQAVIDQTIRSSPMKRYGTLDEQAGPILFLASDDASYITGITVPVGGGDPG